MRVRLTPRVQGFITNGNIFMRTIEKILGYTFLGITSVLLLLTLFDTMQVSITQGRDYMFSKSETWSRQGLFNYLITNLLFLSVLICFFIVGMIKIKHKKNVKFWNIVFYIFFLLMFVSLFYGYYHWAATGFDH